MADKETTLYSPAGEKYVTASAVEANRLILGHGYSTKKPTPKQVEAVTGENPKK